MIADDPIKTRHPPWHALPPSAVLTGLGRSESGLSGIEARERLAVHGPNRLPEAKPRSAVRRLFAQFHNVLIYVLLAAAAVTMLLQHWIDATAILGVVVANAVIGFVLEGRAEDALAAIRGMLSPQAMVIRNGMRRAIAASELVPGDVLPLQAGDRVPADLRILTSRNL